MAFVVARGYPWVIAKLTPLLEGESSTLNDEDGLQSINLTSEQEGDEAFKQVNVDYDLTPGLKKDTCEERLLLISTFFSREVNDIKDNPRKGIIKHGIKLGQKTFDSSNKWWEVWYLVINKSQDRDWAQIKVYTKMWTKDSHVEGETKAQRYVAVPGSSSRDNRTILQYEVTE